MAAIGDAVGVPVAVAAAVAVAYTDYPHVSILGIK